MSNKKQRYFSQYYNETGQMIEVYSKTLKGLKIKLSKHPIIASASLHDIENPRVRLGYYKPRHHLRNKKP